MAFPENITRDHLLKAVSKVDSEGIPKDADSQYYDVVFNGKRYPPKLLVSYANLFANGEVLDRSQFNGGIGTESFMLLENQGFTITKKASQIVQQIQSFTNLYRKEVELKHSSTLNSYKILVNQLPDEIKRQISEERHFIMKGSIGQGVNTYYPWIGIFEPKVSSGATNGFYVVLLFSDDFEDLYLTLNQGSTVQTKEETEAYRNFVFSNYPNVEGFQKGRLPQNSLTKTKSGSSAKNGKKYEETNIFYRKYRIDSLEENDFIVHLNRIVHVYFDCADKYSPTSPLPIIEIMPPANINFSYQDFCIATKNAGLFITDDLILRFVSALLTKPFVILTGLSGSGKTKLAQAFAMWICEDETQYCMVPVGADWTNREPLLGFPNALKANEYVKPENRVLDLIIGANKNENKPYFLILDEMNLSHVERYFADFLSVMESKRKISLHSGPTDWNNIPAEIGFPKNLFIIGTVNIDETTYMFSPKVLDRASVIEFRVAEKQMEEYLQSNSFVDLGRLEAEGSGMAQSFVAIAKDINLEANNLKDLNKILLNFFSELKKSGAEFGYRSASEILRFAAVAKKLGIGWGQNEIADAAIMQKLLPKVHGSRRKLEPILKTLGGLCLKDTKEIEILIAKFEIAEGDKEKISYPISFEKILRMYQNLISNGFTSYAEA